MYKEIYVLFQEEIMKKKKFISVLLVLSVVVACLCVFTACGEDNTAKTAQHKKAIVICTALLSGGLYDTETGAAIWDPVAEGVYFQQTFPDGDMMGLILSVLSDKDTYGLIGDITKYKEGSENLLWQVTLNEQGVSVNNPRLRPANVLPTTADGNYTPSYWNENNETLGGYGSYTYGEKIQYGAIAAYRQQCLDLQAKYGDDWDVTVFNYDWRMDNRRNSELLEQFIETNGWQEVILTSHSMGGPVVAGYIARLYNKYISDPENNKHPNELIRAYRAFSPATAGSVDAIYYLDDPVGCCVDAVTGVLGDKLGNTITGIQALSDGLQHLAAPLVQNMTSVMQLLPFQTFLDSEYYADDESCVYVDGEPVRDLYEWYCSRPWAHTSDWISGVDGIYDKLKPAMRDLREYWDSFYLDTNTDGIKDTFAPDVVNTIYCLGRGYNTKKSLQFVTSDTDTVRTNKITYHAYDTFNHNYDTPLTSVEYYSFDHNAIIYGDGDGTMPTNSCIGGQNYNGGTYTLGNPRHNIAAVNGTGKPIKFYTADHGSVGGYWDILKYDFYEMIDKINEEDALNPFFA